jgi:hypothetical protein
MEYELQLLALHFGCGLLCHSILSNQFYVILRFRPDVVPVRGITSCSWNLWELGINHNATKAHPALRVDCGSVISDDPTC